MTLALQDSSGARIAQRIAVAVAFRDRLIGLLGRRHLDPQEGMLFRPGGSIHTLGMHISIDVAFLGADDCVLRTCERVPPFRLCIAPHGTRSTLELAAGRLAQARVHKGEYLKFLNATASSA